MDIARNRKAWTISLSQEHYTMEILEKLNMLDSTPSKVPMAPTYYRVGEVASDNDQVALTPSQHDIFRAIMGYVSFQCIGIIRDIDLRLASSTSDIMFPRNST
jgi:hypothetical protein